MRIAFLAPYTKKYLYQICGISDLSVKGKDVWFFRYLPDRSVDVDIIGCLASFSYKKRIPLVLLQIAAFLPSLRRYDAVISAGFLSGIVLSAARKLLKLRKPVHIILDTRAVGVVGPGKPLATRIARWLLQPVDGVVCFSRNHQELWETQLGFRQKAAFSPWPMVQDLRQVSVTAGDYIFSGGSTRRDWRTLISAVENIASSVTIVAGKDSATGKYGLEGIEIPRNVRVLRSVPRETYSELLSGSRFVVIPVHEVATDVGWDTLSQSMTLGKAVVTTAIPPLVDYVTDGETAILVPPNDVARLREKVLFLLAHPEEARRIGANARVVMEETKSGRKAAGERIWSMLERVSADAGKGQQAF